MTRPLLLLVAILLLFANFQMWLFSTIDRGLERAEQRRYMVLNDSKTKFVYYCLKAGK